jgi:7-keto-8-aminopelargonate synthetase-like enzyme
MAAAVLLSGAGSTNRAYCEVTRMLRALEQRFAAFKGPSARSIFRADIWRTSRYSTFPEADDIIYSDELNHASLIDGARLPRASRIVFPHGCPGEVPAGRF